MVYAVAVIPGVPRWIRGVFGFAAGVFADLPPGARRWRLSGLPRHDEEVSDPTSSVPCRFCSSEGRCDPFVSSFVYDLVEDRPGTYQKGTKAPSGTQMIYLY